MSSSRRRTLFWTLPITLVLLSGLLFAGLVFANQTLNGFGIDSDDGSAAQIALYSDGASNDWAAGPDGGSGVFQLTPEGSDPTAAEGDCYGSNIDFGEINGVAAFICDGHADSALSGGDAGDLADEEELNIVSGGKQVVTRSVGVECNLGSATVVAVGAESNIYLACTNCNHSLRPPFHWEKPPGSLGQPTENPTESP